MITWWIHSNLHNYLTQTMLAAIGQKTNYLQMPTLPLRPQIPQFTSEYCSRKMNRFIYNFTNFCIVGLLFSYYTSHTLWNIVCMGLFILLILSRVLYICVTFNLTGDCCGRDRMVVLFSANNSSYPITNYFYIGNHWFHFNWQWNCNCSDRMVVEFSTSN
jgi:hypothetical protein